MFVLTEDIQTCLTYFPHFSLLKKMINKLKDRMKN